MESTLTAQRYYVNGEWKESTTGNVVEIMSPYKEGVVGTVQALSQEEGQFNLRSKYKKNGQRFPCRKKPICFINGLMSFLLCRMNLHKQ